MYPSLEGANPGLRHELLGPEPLTEEGDGWWGLGWWCLGMASWQGSQWPLCWCHLCQSQSISVFRNKLGCLVGRACSKQGRRKGVHSVCEVLGRLARGCFFWGALFPFFDKILTSQSSGQIFTMLLRPHTVYAD